MTLATLLELTKIRYLVKIAGIYKYKQVAVGCVHTILTKTLTQGS